MKKMIKYPEIKSFRDIVKQITENTRFQGLNENNEPIFDENIKLPVINFLGTIKLHGTNAGISMNKDGELWAQSRKNIITPEKDNNGFAFFVTNNKDIIKELFQVYQNYEYDIITIFGEWVGNNIQKGKAVCELEKKFVIFEVKLSYEDPEKNSYYLPDQEVQRIKSPENNIYNIFDFKTYSIDIDFNNPKNSIEYLNNLTNEVYQECPFSKEFGEYGSGEGIVWKKDNGKGGKLRFKVKAEDENNKKKNKKSRKKATIDPVKLKNIKEFVDYAVDEERLYQGIEMIFTINNEKPDKRKLGDFIKWIYNDVIKEETDTLNKNDLEPKDVSKEISRKARDWFLEKYEKMEF